jgi:ribosome biogenesis GTPase / thiamine phosphate phosphatase
MSKVGAPALRRGEVIAAHGRHYAVELDDGTPIQAYPKGKKSVVACGDLVQLRLISENQGTIEVVEPRSALLYRSDKYRQKLFAANLSRAAWLPPRIRI